MAALGPRFCARAFSSCGKWGPLFIAVHGPLTIAASLVAEHRLQTRKLSNCSSRAQLLRGMWELPRPGLEPVSPALAGGLPTTAPPGKPHLFLRLHLNFTKMVTNFLSLMCAWSYAKNIKYFLFIPQDKYYYPHFQNEGTEGQRIQVIHSKPYSLKRSCQNLNTIIDPKSIHFVVSTKY